MIAVQAECAAWFEALRDSATATALQELIDLDRYGLAGAATNCLQSTAQWWARLNDTSHTEIPTVRRRASLRRRHSVLCRRASSAGEGMPSTGKPTARWKLPIAALVCGPATPSAGPCK